MSSFSVVWNEHASQLIFGTLFFSCALLMAWKNRFFTLPNLANNQPRLSSKALIGCLATFLLTTLLIAPALALTLLSLKYGYWINPSAIPLDSFTQGILNILVMISMALMMVLFLHYTSQETQQAVLRGKPQLRDLLVGAATWLVCFPLVVIVSQLIEFVAEWQFNHISEDQRAVYFLKLTKDYPWLFFSMAFLIVVIIPMIEELIFRGFIQTWLKQRLNLSKAIAISSLIFAAAHFSFSQGWDNIELLTALFILSCFLGFVYERQQSLWASISLHATFNLISVIAILASL